MLMEIWYVGNVTISSILEIGEMYIVKPSVINQLKAISQNFQELIDYEMDVSGDDMTDCILYSKIKDSIDNQIKEIESR